MTPRAYRRLFWFLSGIVVGLVCLFLFFAVFGKVPA